MARRKRDPRLGRSLFSLRSYLTILVVVALAATATPMLLLWDSDYASGSDSLLRMLSAFGNVFLVSALVTAAYGMFQRISMRRPIEQILEFTHRVTRGDFEARLPERDKLRRNEFDAIAEDLNVMVAELSSVETLRTDFVASVSHELKTPLAQISNYATMLTDEGLSADERQDYVERIRVASGRLSDLITNVLRLNKLENQEIFPSHEAFDLAEQLRECLLDFEGVWEARDIAVEVDFPEEVVVTSDQELLSLVWHNLLSNAFKFTPGGGSVSVFLERLPQGVRVGVSDTGAGMAPEVASHVFDKFYQGDPAHATYGNGLGLALVRRVCDILGATVDVESAEGEGSTFLVSIPTR